MIAAHQLGRKCFGLELEPRYCDVVIKRMLKYDAELNVSRNGVDETQRWMDLINN